MSNPDSFIEEVTEEVRRDRLFNLFRKYGWIGAVVVVGIVGGAAWNEWSKSQAAARAQGFGDALVDALDHGTPEERRAALSAVPTDGQQAAILNRPGLAFFSVRVDAISPVVTYFTHYDLFLNGGWATLGAPIGLTNPVSSIG